MLDVIIIGAGPTGINCAIAAKEAGLDYLVIEKGLLVNSIFNFPTNMTFFSTSKLLEIGDIPFISHTDKPTRKEALEYYRRLWDYYDLKISFKERVQNLIGEKPPYTVVTDQSEYTCRAVVVATGFYDQVNRLHVPGEDLPKVKHYYDEPHHYIGQKIVVVGGANSACDVALETWQKGAEVTMVVREPELYPKVKYWILPNIKNRIAEGSIKAYFSSQITKITASTASISTPDGHIELPNDYVLAMTGYRPDYDLLDALGIEIQSDDLQTPAVDPECLRTNLDQVYMAGVMLGGLKTNKYFIENTRDHGKIIMDQIRKQKKKSGST